jgi:DNA-binding SARP family transcriptional activator/tetratricopeptide (TPR) repeat protein
VRFEVVGPLRVLDGAGTVRPVTVTQHRRLLCALLLKANQPVSFDELADMVWDGAPPAGSRATLRNYVKLLRQALGPEVAPRLRTRSPGYLVEVGEDELDLRQFTQLCQRGRDAIHGLRWAEAREDLAAALALWRGPLFADTPLGSVHNTEGPHLAEVRLQALEWRIEADLQLGRHDGLGWELQRLVDEYPLRERFWAQLLLALYRTGRQSEALLAYQSARTVLRAELGVEPGPELRELHRRILAADAALVPVAPPRAAVPRPAQLPLDVPGFAARDTELAQLDAVLAEADRRTTAVAISAVSGTAGVGKTALAVHWAHRVAGSFPDGQLYLDLRGFDPGGAHLDPTDAVRALLDALAVEPRRIPAGLAAQAALYRSTLAKLRMLIVLDNARDDDQVRPLLPGAPGCLVVVTSRNQLSGLVATESAYPLILDVPDVPAARRLLAERIGAARTLAEPDAVDDIIDRCARLPLALAVVAARAVTHPDLSLGTLAAELVRAHNALDAFDGPEPASDVRTVFSWSYQALSAGAARVFRLLGLHPGPHLATPAVASLAGVPPGAVRPLLAELTRAHLLNEYRPGRYTFHDLLRAYASELVETVDDDEEREAAVHRVLDHYLHTAHRAALLLHPHRVPLKLDPARPGVTVEQLDDRDAALAWFTVESPTLLGAMRLAERAGFDRHVWKLTWACSDFLGWQGKWQIYVATYSAARAAAERIDDRVGLAQAHRGLGAGFARLGRYDEAGKHLDQALSLSRELGDHMGQALMHINAGWVMEAQDRFGEAISHSQQALDLFRTLGHRAGQANALNNIGWYHTRNGDHAAAIAMCEQALAVHVAIGDRAGQAATHDSIGYAHLRLGNYRAAIASLQEGVTLFQECGNRYQEAATLRKLGDAHGAVGDDESARRSWRQALTVLEELDHPDAEQVRAKLTT